MRTRMRHGRGVTRMAVKESKRSNSRVCHCHFTVASLLTVLSLPCRSTVTSSSLHHRLIASSWLHHRLIASLSPTQSMNSGGCGCGFFFLSPTACGTRAVATASAGERADVHNAKVRKALQAQAAQV